MFSPTHTLYNLQTSVELLWLKKKVAPATADNVADPLHA